jgi:hypothetical protein
MRLATLLLAATPLLFGVSSLARASSCNRVVVEPIRFAKGAVCWHYAGKATHFKGTFLKGQRVTVEMQGEEWEATDVNSYVSKPIWTARSPEINGPHGFFAAPNGDPLADPTGKLDAVLPESGQYTFGFSPCAMWNGYGHVSICSTTERMPLPASAASPTIPEQFRGDWCNDDAEASVLTMHRCKTYNNTNFRITAHSYGAIKSNWDCTFISINFSDDAGDKGVSAVSTDSLCVRDMTLKMRSIFQLNENGALVFMTVAIERK